MKIFNLFKKVIGKMRDKESIEVLNNGFIATHTEPLNNKLLDMWEIAQAYGYNSYEHQEKNKMISFFKTDIRINVYYTTMTVGTCIKHPVQGKTQLFRRNVTSPELENIFRYPRVHTNKGYKGRSSKK